MKSTKRTPSLQKSLKLYPLNQSPLFKLKNKKKLLQVIGLSKKQADKLMLDSAFKEFENDAGRKIQEPIAQLKAVHRKIGFLLSRIELPPYLHSGRKKHSTLTNAESHKQATELLKLDIHKFFPSTRAAKVYKAFVDKFEMSPDVAYVMTNLATFAGKVPTGSPISMAIAFWANKDMFDELSNLAASNSLVFTAYVDDVAFSGSKIPKGFAAQAKKCIRSHGLTSKDKKERFYSSSEGKLLTGIVIQDGELKVRWAHNDSIGKEFAILAEAKDNAAKIIHLEKLAGKLHAAGQVDSRQKDKARFFTQQLKTAKKLSEQGT
ncbi:reverse transcriptase family protein [Enterobacter hormaechei]|uniref:reverse transcriptase family protein n=1 Tax=unclassified Enterobacter cloacae complex TaxID=2757714 RepID=UPI001868C5C3|nr:MULTISPECIES: reverse transcriptase family protein [unclassified Enterobacter cloacae complex]ELC6556617.1 RNA-directed DNA polymerase [Enterobacter hormaechei]MBE4900176.1 RNA-directed DNA polymerase [Enterobacter cloacae complex sp. P8RS]HAV1567817.1 RNA-directed DNA polymerase [Enterobacter hormaechei subsp. steigerwaltii]MBE3488028.1 RNA-directed DNA polymerase [Enterobacter cloacae complex sp. P8BA]MBE4824709.1 RNA-directed DNA polymerase [Enterobacter cloacae complex sp. S1]